MPRGAMLGAGREAEIYEWGAGTVVKLYRPGFSGHRSEAAVLTGLAGHGFAPRLVDVIEHEGRAGLVLEWLEGVDMLSLLPRRPWNVTAFARLLAEVQLRVHAITGSPGLPELRHALSALIRDADLPTRSRDLVLRILDGLPDGDRLCHGDFHPGNILIAPHRTSVIDWVAATRGVPEADHTRTLLLLRLGAPLPGTPALVRVLIGAGRSLLTNTYLRAYQKGSARPLHDTAAWTVVNAAARLAEGLDQERPRLLRIINRANQPHGLKGLDRS